MSRSAYSTSFIIRECEFANSNIKCLHINVTFRSFKQQVVATKCASGGVLLGAHALSPTLVVAAIRLGLYESVELRLLRLDYKQRHFEPLDSIEFDERFGPEHVASLEIRFEPLERRLDGSNAHMIEDSVAVFCKFCAYSAKQLFGVFTACNDRLVARCALQSIRRVMHAPTSIDDGRRLIGHVFERHLGHKQRCFDVTIDAQSGEQREHNSDVEAEFCHKTKVSK